MGFAFRAVPSTAAVLAAAVLALVVVPAATHAAVSFSGTYNAHDGWAYFVDDTCLLQQPYSGAEPDPAGKYPVLVYIHGTGAEQGDLAVGKAVTAAAAARGFLAVMPTYRGGETVTNPNGIDVQAKCMFNRSNGKSLLAAVCARPKADCTRIVVAGHSQGGNISLRAANWASGVRAAWALGVFDTMWSNIFTSREQGGTRALPNSGVRVVTGLSDMTTPGPDTWGSVNRFTGQSCAWFTTNCMRSDGSGWYVVQHAAPPNGPTDAYADHCYMNENGRRCIENAPVDPYWRTGSAVWTMPSALTWLGQRAG